MKDETLIVGRNPVREALEDRDETIEKVLIQNGTGGRSIQEIRQLAAAARIPVQYVPPVRLKKMVGGINHQGVLAVAAAMPYLEVEEMLNEIAADPDVVRATKPIVLVLDQIEDPYNYGAILRSAVAAGASGVIVPSRKMAPLNATVLKASAGMARRIPVARTHNLADVFDQLKERGYWVAGAAGDGEVTMWEMDWDRPLVLVIGSEERGMRPRVASQCDYRVAIPMPGPAESLNASVAAGILLFMATQPRLGG